LMSGLGYYDSGQRMTRTWKKKLDCFERTNLK
jgi:hypothetical protein